jgi:5,10-methylenetetrahydrofolate reductase
MVDEIHGWAEQEVGGTDRRFNAGVTTRLTRIPPWKREADFVFVQISFSAERLLAWRETVELECPVYPGVLVLASSSMAKGISANLSEVDVPEALLDQLDSDEGAGVDAACQLVLDVRDTGAFEGVHLVPVGRYREVARRLEALLTS